LRYRRGRQVTLGNNRVKVVGGEDCKSGKPGFLTLHGLRCAAEAETWWGPSVGCVGIFVDVIKEVASELVTHVEALYFVFWFIHQSR
jgi:hypothetical protein